MTYVCPCGDPNCGLNGKQPNPMPFGQWQYKSAPNTWWTKGHQEQYQKIYDLIKAESVPKEWVLPEDTPAPKKKRRKDSNLDMISKMAAVIDDLTARCGDMEVKIQSLSQLLGDISREHVTDVANIRNLSKVHSNLLLEHETFICTMKAGREDYKDVLDRLEELAGAVDELEKR